MVSLYLQSFLHNARGCHFYTNSYTGCSYVKELKLKEKNAFNDCWKSNDTTISMESSQALANYMSDSGLRSNSIMEIKGSLGQRKAGSELEALVVDLTQAVLYTFEPFGARFPAMERLTLIGYIWDHAQSKL